MRSIADTRRLTVARRLAAGMPAWAVAERARKAVPEAAPATGHGLSPGDLEALNEIRTMYRRLPPERLVAMCRKPPRGIEKLFAVLVLEIGIRPAKPQGP